MNKAFLFAAALPLAASAAPEITMYTPERNGESHLVTITYDLTEDAIVTAQVFDGNGVALPQSEYGDFGGDVHKYVTAGEGLRVFWKQKRDIDGATVKLAAWTKENAPDYLAVDMCVSNLWRFYVTAADVPGGVTNRLYKTDKMLMRKIYAKDVEWPMGHSSDASATSLGHALHTVKLTEDYYIAVYEMTAAQYSKAVDKEDATARSVNVADVRPQAKSWSVMRGGGSSLKNIWPDQAHEVDSGLPIHSFRVSTGLAFDMPTEAQWEYACRAGTPTCLYTGDGLTAENVDKVAWYTANWANDPNGEPSKMHEVGLLAPNAWGLYDMLGNGSEFCLDCVPQSGSNVDIYQGAYAVDPVGPTSGGGTGNQGRHARRGGGVTNSISKTAMPYTACRADQRQSINWSAGYVENAHRFVIPATIP